MHKNERCDLVKFLWAVPQPKLFAGDSKKIQKSRTAEKSEDELRKFSIDPNLSPLDRNLKLLNGNDIQKSVACRSLVFLMDQIPQNEMTQILDGVKMALEASKDNHQVRGSLYLTRSIDHLDFTGLVIHCENPLLGYV